MPPGERTPDKRPEDYKDGASGQRSQGYLSHASRSKGQSDHQQVGERNQHHTQGQSLDGTNSRSRRDKGPRGHTAQNNPLPQNGGGGLANKNVDRQDER
jgi:hypothetical protein